MQVDGKIMTQWWRFVVPIGVRMHLKWMYQVLLNRQLKRREKSLDLMIHMMRIRIYKRWCCITCIWFLSLLHQAFGWCMQAEGGLVSRQTVEVECLNFWKAPLWSKFLRSHEKLAKYQTKCTQLFEVIDNIVQQFPLKEIKSHQNKGWVRIPKDIKSKISEIADKIRGVTIQTIMPCVTNKKSAHLLCVDGYNTKSLVRNIPCNTLFALEKQLLEYSSCTLFACQEEIYFGVGQRNTDNEQQLNQYQRFPLQCKLMFDNKEHQCMLGAFMKVFCEVLTTSGQDILMKYICNHKDMWYKWVRLVQTVEWF